MTHEYFRQHAKENFELDNKKRIKAMGNDADFQKLSKKWAIRSLDYKYPLHFKWLGRPILQFPQDIVAMQEIIWRVKPEVIVETGVARGGTLVFYASMLQLLGNGGETLGIEIALRKHNRVAILKHPLGKKIKLFDGSSTDPKVVNRVCEYVGKRKAMVILDSNHEHAHVLEELRLYSALVKKGSYLIVSDTFLEDFPQGRFPDRPWDKGNNPGTAVAEFLKTNRRFENDKELVDKLGITACATGYLKCIRN